MSVQERVINGVQHGVGKRHTGSELAKHVDALEWEGTHECKTMQDIVSKKAQDTMMSPLPKQ